MRERVNTRIPLVGGRHAPRRLRAALAHEAAAAHEGRHGAGERADGPPPYAQQGLRMPMQSSFETYLPLTNMPW